VAILAKSHLYGLKEYGVHNRFMLPEVALALVNDLPHKDPVLEQIKEGAGREACRGGY
jgi:hypothetical protein